MPSCNTCRLTWVSLTLDVGVSVHGCSINVQLLLLSLDEVYLLTAAPPDLERGVAPLGPPAPLSHCSLDIGLLLSATAPGLGHGMAPPGSACVP